VWPPLAASPAPAHLTEAVCTLVSTAAASRYVSRMSGLALEIDKLTKRYGDVLALTP
jgi:hypothetical protein